MGKLEMKNLTKTFNPGTVNEKTALSGLSLTVEDGDFITIVGSNGAGKSTLFHAIAGVFYVDGGSIVLDGEDITYKPEYRRSREMGRLFQDPMRGTAPHMTIEENLALAYLRTAKHQNAFFSRTSKADRTFFRDQLARLDYRLAWEDDIRDYLLDLDAKKPVVYCGDLNVAHQEIDIKNPGPNRRNPGFTDEEREKMTKLLSSGFVDTFRYLYPDKTGAYSWWSYRFNARKNNAGWRIDYFIVSERLKDKIRNADIWSEVLGSDHCPVVLDLDV